MVGGERRESRRPRRRYQAEPSSPGQLEAINAVITADVRKYMPGLLAGTMTAGGNVDGEVDVKELHSSTSRRQDQ